MEFPSPLSRGPQIKQGPGQTVKQENLFLLNGIEYSGAAGIDTQPAGTIGKLLGVDAVREFNMPTGVFGVGYRKRPGV